MLLVSGANSSGKSRLSCAIASMLYKMMHACRVIAFDTSGIRKTISDLPNLAKVYTYGKELL